jgi:hypothetical protein
MILVGLQQRKFSFRNPGEIIKNPTRQVGRLIFSLWPTLNGNERFRRAPLKEILPSFLGVAFCGPDIEPPISSRNILPLRDALIHLSGSIAEIPEIP